MKLESRVGLEIDCPINFTKDEQSLAGQQC